MALRSSERRLFHQTWKNINKEGCLYDAFGSLNSSSKTKDYMEGFPQMGSETMWSHHRSLFSWWTASGPIRWWWRQGMGWVFAVGEKISFAKPPYDTVLKKIICLCQESTKTSREFEFPYYDWRDLQGRKPRFGNKDNSAN